MATHRVVNKFEFDPEKVHKDVLEKITEQLCRRTAYFRILCHTPNRALRDRLSRNMRAWGYGNSKTPDGQIEFNASQCRFLKYPECFSPKDIEHFLWVLKDVFKKMKPAPGAIQLTTYQAIIGGQQ